MIARARNKIYRFKYIEYAHTHTLQIYTQIAIFPSFSIFASSAENRSSILIDSYDDLPLLYPALPLSMVFIKKRIP